MVSTDLASPLMAANRQMLDGADSCYCGLLPLPLPGLGLGGGVPAEARLAPRPGRDVHTLPQLPPLGSRLRPLPPHRLFPQTLAAQGLPRPRRRLVLQGRHPTLTTAPTLAWNAIVSDSLTWAMGSGEWRDWLRYWTGRYLAWGADGMYYDQFKHGLPKRQALPPTSRTLTVVGPRGTLDTIAKLRETSRAANPYYTSSGEVCNDVYGQYLDLHMTSGVLQPAAVLPLLQPRPSAHRWRLEQRNLEGSWRTGTLPLHLAGGRAVRAIPAGHAARHPPPRRQKPAL